jgi:signal transduction histidine kinase
VVALDAKGKAQALAVRSTPPLPADAALWQRALAGRVQAGADVERVDDVANSVQADGDGSANSAREELHAQLLDADVRGYLVIPLMAQEAVIGTLNLEATSADAFGQEHVDLASQVGASLAMALQNARLYAAAQQELTERKLAEAALRESEATLRQKAEDLQARNDELDAFAHTVAHDLKTPLALLIGYTSFLEAGEGQDPEQHAMCIHAVGQSARKMGSIIDELLLLSRVRKVDEVNLSPLNMGEIVGDVLIRLTDVIEHENVAIRKPEIWPVAWGYGPWIEEVWANYINNAIKYGGTPPQIELGADVIASDVPGSEEPAQVRFWVRDNGNGLTEEQQKRLFIPFERLDQARAKGYGLGLSIVQRIMEKLGGAVGVESAGVPSEGATFYFQLPMADLD